MSETMLAEDVHQVAQNVGVGPVFLLEHAVEDGIIVGYHDGGAGRYELFGGADEFRVYAERLAARLLDD
jgi:hypothetical protein